MLLPKPGKDPGNCASYRPISLLDAMLLVIILALRLTTVIEDLIHVVQSGLMSGKGTVINIHRLFLILAANHENALMRVVASLDTKKPLTWLNRSFSGRCCQGSVLGLGSFNGWACCTMLHGLRSEPIPEYQTPFLYGGGPVRCRLCPSLLALALIRESWLVKGWSPGGEDLVVCR